MTTTQKATLVFFALLLTIFVTFLFMLKTQEASASAYPGLHATVATSSNLTVGPSEVYNSKIGSYMGTSTSAEGLSVCADRIVSTTNQPIMLQVSSAASTSLNGSNGIWQGASTTVAYDGGLYGCGYWSFYSYASTTITVVETR